jgi:hypothetical protein
MLLTRVAASTHSCKQEMVVGAVWGINPFPLVIICKHQQCHWNALHDWLVCRYHYLAL